MQQRDSGSVFHSVIADFHLQNNEHATKYNIKILRQEFTNDIDYDTLISPSISKDRSEMLIVQVDVQRPLQKFLKLGLSPVITITSLPSLENTPAAEYSLGKVDSI